MIKVVDSLRSKAVIVGGYEIDTILFSYDDHSLMACLGYKSVLKHFPLIEQYLNPVEIEGTLVIFPNELQESLELIDEYKLIASTLNADNVVEEKVVVAGHAITIHKSNGMAAFPLTEILKFCYWKDIHLSQLSFDMDSQFFVNPKLVESLIKKGKTKKNLKAKLSKGFG